MPMPIRLRATAMVAGLSLALVPLLAPLTGGSGAGLLPALAQQSQGLKVLRISAIPDQKPEKLNRLYPLVAQELSQQLGVTVKYVPMVDYPAAVSAFRTGDLQKSGAKVVAQRDIDASFNSIFIASTRSGLQPFRQQKGLTSLKGRRFTFGSESSTSGRLMPQYFLTQAGVKLSDFAGGAPGFSGSHDATIALVSSGAYDAGVVNEQVWLSSLKDGKANPTKVIALWKSPGYQDYHWIAQPNLDQRFGKGFSSRLTKAILAWRPSDPKQKQILELFGAQKFVPASASFYGRIEQVGRQIGKIR
jgi:phosphonate transport system substrate-binding protein